MTEMDIYLTQTHSKAWQIQTRPVRSSPMMRLMKYLLLIIVSVVSIVAFLRWSERRPDAHYLSDLRTYVAPPYRNTEAPAELLLVQAQLSPVDYQSVEHLRLKLDTLLRNARDAGLMDAHTLVVLPDHVGTWLLATGEKVEFYQSKDRYEVRDWLLLGNPLLAIRALLSNLDAHRLDEALLRMKAEEMARAYQGLFADLAKRYGVTLVAGSILLPSPVLEDGELHAQAGPLRNATLVFSASGDIVGDLHSDPWPFDPALPAQRISLNGTDYAIERDIDEGFARTHVRRLDNGQISTPLFLRGSLDWPIGGLPRRIRLSAPMDMQESNPGSHLIPQWSLP
jgi:hypothetical protein